MVNYKDLMVGNYVYNSERNKFPMKVVSIGEDYCYLDFEGNEGDVFEGISHCMAPIEVNGIVLYTIGFNKIQLPVQGDAHYYKKINELTINIIHGISKIKGCDWRCFIENDLHQVIGSFEFQYIHELQNGFKIVTKIDLDIENL